MNDNDIEINLDNENENIDVDREDSIYTNISEEEMNEIKSRIQANENDIVILKADSGNKVALSIDSNYVMTLQLLNKNNEVLSTGTIDLPIESMIVNASYSNGILTLTLQNGNTLDVDISAIVSGLVSETTFNQAVSRLEGLISGLDTRMTTAEEDINTLKNDVSDIKAEQATQNTNIGKKVDKVAGKGLSTEDYTTAEKNKLADLENYDDTEVKESIDELEAKHDEEVAELNEKIADLQEELDMTADLIPTDTPEPSTNITVNDSARYTFKKFEVGGNSEQKNYIGKNKLNTLIDHESGYKTTVGGITYTLNSDGSINVEGTATSNSNFTFSANKQTIEAPLKMRGQFIGTIQGETRFTCYTSSWGNTTNISMTNNDLVTKIINTINFSIFRVIVTEGTTINGTLYLGITDTDVSDEWEPYVGGQPAPNPEYNFPIRNVGDNVNLFDKDNIVLNQYINISTGQNVANENWNTTDYIPVKFNNQYCINKAVVGNSNNAGICYYDVNKNFLSGESWNNLNYTNPTERENILFSITNNTVKYIKISFRPDTNFDTLKIEEDTVATGYSPYNCGSVDVKVQNKNLLPINELSASQATNILYFYPLILFAGTYTLSFNLGTIMTRETTIRFYYEDETSKSITINANITSATFELTKNVTKITWYVREAVTITNIQLEKGSTATSYEAHEEQTVTLQLPEEMEMCKIGDYADKFVKQDGKWYKYKQIDKVILNGTEGYTANTSQQLTNTSYFYKYSGFDNAKKGGASVIKSSHFLGKSIWGLDEQGIYIDTSLSYNRLRLRIDNNIATTAEELKSWLASNNVIIYYVLETPIYEEITDETLIKQLDSLSKLYSYKGTTHISSDNNPSPIFTVTYRKDPNIRDTRLDALEARVALLEG